MDARRALSRPGPVVLLPVRRRRCRSCPQSLRRCPVQAECLEYTLQYRIEHGVWGGASERERRRILRAAPHRRSLQSPLAGWPQLNGARSRSGRRPSSSARSRRGRRSPSAITRTPNSSIRRVGDARERGVVALPHDHVPADVGRRRAASPSSWIVARRPATRPSRLARGARRPKPEQAVAVEQLTVPSPTRLAPDQDEAVPDPCGARSSRTRQPGVAATARPDLGSLGREPPRRRARVARTPPSVESRRSSNRSRRQEQAGRASSNANRPTTSPSRRARSMTWSRQPGDPVSLGDPLTRYFAGPGAGADGRATAAATRVVPSMPGLPGAHDPVIVQPEDAVDHLRPRRRRRRSRRRPATGRSTAGEFVAAASARARASAPAGGPVAGRSRACAAATNTMRPAGARHRPAARRRFTGRTATARRGAPAPDTGSPVTPDRTRTSVASADRGLTRDWGRPRARPRRSRRPPRRPASQR